MKNLIEINQRIAKKHKKVMTQRAKNFCITSFLKYRDWNKENRP